MSTAQLRRQLKNRIDKMPVNRLRTAADFLTYLHEREEDEAMTLVPRKPLYQRLAQAQRDIARGRVTPVNKLKRKHRRV